MILAVIGYVPTSVAPVNGAPFDEYVTVTPPVAFEPAATLILWLAPSYVTVLSENVYP